MNAVTEGNKLIAEFMGYTYFGHNDERLKHDNGFYDAGWKRKATIRKFDKMAHSKKAYLCRNHNELRYYNSWDWLKPVIDHITDIDNQADEILAKKLEAQKLELFHLSILAPLPIAWKAVVDFITWFYSDPEIAHTPPSCKYDLWERAMKNAAIEIKTRINESRKPPATNPSEEA